MSQIYQVLNSIGEQWKTVGLIVLILSIFIDLSPKVKFNPWKAIFGAIGRYLNNSIEKEIAGFKTDVYEKIDELSEQQEENFEAIKREQELQAETLNNLIQDLNYKELSRLRWDITDFESSLNRGNKYPREQYRHIIDEADKYIRMADDPESSLIVDAEDIIKIKEATDRIRNHYQEHKKENPSAFMI